MKSTFLKNKPGARTRDVERLIRWAEKLDCSAHRQSGTIYAEAPDGDHIEIILGPGGWASVGDNTVNGAVKFLKEWAAGHQYEEPVVALAHETLAAEAVKAKLPSRIVREITAALTVPPKRTRRATKRGRK